MGSESHWTPHLTSLIPYRDVSCQECSDNEMECAEPHPSVWEVHWFIVAAGLQLIPGQSYLFLLGVMLQAQISQIPWFSLLLFHLHYNVLSFLLPCSDHLFTPHVHRDNKGGGITIWHLLIQLYTLVRRCKIVWFLGLIRYSVRGELPSQMMFQLKSPKSSAVCWPKYRTDGISPCRLEMCSWDW